jgi:Domain of unknown function (DUF4426)
MKKYLNKLKFAVLFIATFFCSANTHAQINQTKEIQTAQTFGDYTVHYAVFNSKTIPADLANTYHLKRGSNTAIVNIALTKTLANHKGVSLGRPAKISGTATNLMQQVAALNFSEVQEGDPKAETSATYYLASFYYINEEDIHFSVSVSPLDDPTKSFEVNFTRRLYTEN